MRLEQAELADAELSRASFLGFGKLLQGTRRHNLVFPEQLAAGVAPEGAQLTFVLPAGSYATVGAVENVIPVDLKLPGCPPTPDGLLYAVNLIQQQIREGGRGGILAKS